VVSVCAELAKGKASMGVAEAPPPPVGAEADDGVMPPAEAEEDAGFSTGAAAGRAEGAAKAASISSSSRREGFSPAC
jgi:hypothetical protein